MARACVFCGALKQSKEHVYPKWLRKLMGTYDSIITITETESGAEVRKTQVPFDVTVNTVCQTCNTGWMQQLEERARPLLSSMIRGEPCELEPAQQRLVAVWFTKTAMMMHERARPSERVIPTAHFEVMFRQEGPPTGTAVWLATQTEPLDGQLSTVYANVDKHKVTATPDPGLPTGTIFYSAGLVIGNLGFILLANTEGPVCAPLPSREANNFVIQAWPTNDRRTWPPRSSDELGGLITLYEWLFVS
jgi:hypothetical protein